MSYKISADSSCNVYRLGGVDFGSVAMKIVTDKKEYVDEPGLNTARMVEELESYKGRSGTACPSIGDWLEAFGEAERVFAVVITSNLSGCYNAAVQAKEVYEEQYPERKVCCLDSLSTGPEMLVIMEKLRELAGEGLSFEETEQLIREYMKHTHLIFSLESLNNMARNGRVSSLVAKAVGVLGIRIVGKASDEGTLQPLHKCRGEKKAKQSLMEELEQQGYRGGRLRIAHCFNEGFAMALRDEICGLYPGADVAIAPTTGLCSFYAERGGVLIGFEDGEA